MKRGPKPKDRAKSPGAEAHCVKEGSPSSGMVPTSESPSLELAHSPSLPHTEPGVQLKRKRSQIVAAAVRKRPRKSSVQAQTLSVTRISVPVHGDSISPNSEIPEESDKEMSPSPSKPSKSDKLVFSSPDRSPPMSTTRRTQIEASAQLPHKKPRSLRVSLSLPEEVEPGSPLEKVVKSQKLLSPKFAVTQSLPLWDDDLNTALIPSSSTEIQSPESISQSGNMSQQKPKSVGDQSPTSSTEGPLTPFTASALPLQATAGNSENGNRKRKREDRENASDPLSPLKKVSLTPTSSPESSPGDVFTDTSVKSGPGTTATNGETADPKPSLTHAISQSSATSGFVPSTPAPASESTDTNNILSGTASTPVGYGAQPTSTVGTPTVIMVQPTLKDKEVETTPKTSSYPVSSADPTTSLPGTVVQEPTKMPVQLSAKPALLSCSENEKPALPAVVPEKQTATPKPPATDRSRQLTQQSAKSSETTASSHSDAPGTGVAHVSTQVSSSQPLPQSIIKSPSVIKSPPRHAVPTTSSRISHAQSSPTSLENETKQLSTSAHAGVRGSSTAVQTTPAQSTSNPVKNAASTLARVNDSNSTKPPPRRLTSTNSVSTPTLIDTNPPLPQSNAAVSVITIRPSSASSETVPTVATSHVGPRKSTVVDQDIIITSVEKRPLSSVNTSATAHSLPSYSEAVHSKNANSARMVITPTLATSHVPSTKSRPQSVFGKQTAAGTRSTTKIAVSIVLLR